MENNEKIMDILNTLDDENFELDIEDRKALSNYINNLHDEYHNLLDIFETQESIYVKDIHTGYVHEVGTNPHDSLLLMDGGLYYHNLQNGDGTSKHGSYIFCNKDGITEYNDEMYDDYYLIGFKNKKCAKDYYIRQQEILRIFYEEQIKNSK